MKIHRDLFLYIIYSNMHISRRFRAQVFRME